MKSPIKNRLHVNNTAAALREIMPPGSVIGTHAFFDGKVEFSLAQNDRFVKAHTSSKPVYEFWKCMSHDSRRICDLATCEDFVFDDEQMFTTLQEMWHKHNSAFVKSALFFLLNSYSDTGLISCGQLKKEFFNPIAVANLRRFKMPETFCIMHEVKDIPLLIDESNIEDYNLIIGGKFSYNLFEHGKSRGPEETRINHRQIIKFMQKTNKRVAVTYDYDRKAVAAAKKLNKIFVDKYGRITNNELQAQEVIVANF